MSLNEARQSCRKNTTSAKKPLFQHDFPGGRSHILVRLSQNRFPASRGGRWRAGGHTHPGLPTWPTGPGPRAPKGPSIQQLQVPPLCGMRANAVLLKRTEELACFFLPFFFF